MSETLLEIKCHQCGNKHCQTTLCLEKTIQYSKKISDLDKEIYSFNYEERNGLSRTIFVSKEDLKRLQKQIKEILK